MIINEIELKFLNINIEEIKEKLNKLWAILKYDNTIESHSFLADGFHWADSNMKFLRVRKNSDDVRITYKDPTKQWHMTNRQEIEIKVDDFNTAISLLEKLNFKKDDIFIKHRIHYELWNIHFELDTVPGIPTYLEIETQSENDMKEICIKLWLDILDGKKWSIFEILPKKFQ